MKPRIGTGILPFGRRSENLTSGLPARINPRRAYSSSSVRPCDLLGASVSPRAAHSSRIAFHERSHADSASSPLWPASSARWKAMPHDIATDGGVGRFSTYRSR